LNDNLKLYYHQANWGIVPRRMKCFLRGRHTFKDFMKDSSRNAYYGNYDVLVSTHCAVCGWRINQCATAEEEVFIDTIFELIKKELREKKFRISEQPRLRDYWKYFRGEI